MVGVIDREPLGLGLRKILAARRGRLEFRSSRLNFGRIHPRRLFYDAAETRSDAASGAAPAAS